MKKGTMVSLIALLVAIAGLMIALIAYFKKRSCALCDDMESDLVEFYDEDEGECACGDGCCCDSVHTEADESVAEVETEPKVESDK